MQARLHPVFRRGGLVKAATRAIFGLILFGGLGACAQAPAPEPVLAAAPGLQLPVIEPMSGDADCDTASQCVTLPIGQKACGGPQRWLAWSSKRLSETELRRLQAGQIGSAVRAPRRPGERSDCVIVADPGAQCLAGRCVLLQGPASLR